MRDPVKSQGRCNYKAEYSGAVLLSGFISSLTTGKCCKVVKQFKQTLRHNTRHHDSFFNTDMAVVSMRALYSKDFAMIFSRLKLRSRDAVLQASIVVQVGLKLLV